MANGPVEEAFIEIKPKVSPTFAEDINRVIGPALKKAADSANKSFKGINASSRQAAGGVAALTRSVDSATAAIKKFNVAARSMNTANKAVQRSADAAALSTKGLSSASRIAATASKNAALAASAAAEATRALTAALKAVERAEIAAAAATARATQANTAQAASATASRNSVNGLSGSFTRLATVAKIGGAAAATALAGIGAFGIKSAANLEQTRIAFDGLFGNTAQADAFVTRIQKFAAETPFEFPELAKATQKLLALGKTGDQAIDILTTVGDAAAAVGADSVAVNRVTIALAQIQAKGKLSAEEINQVGEALPNLDRGAVIQNLAEAFGVTTQEIQKMQQKGLIPAQAGIDALLKTLKEAPGALGAMERQLNTLTGQFSNFKDTVRFSFSNALQSSLPGLASALGDITKTIQKELLTLGPALGRSLETIAPLVSGALEAIGPIFTALLDTVTPALAALAPALQPLGQAIADIITALGPSLGILAKALADLTIALAPLITQFGQQFAQVLTTLLPVLVSIVRGFTDLFKTLLGGQGTLLSLAAALTTVYLAMKALAIISVVQRAFVLLSGTLQASILLFGGVGGAARALLVSLGPVGAAIAAIGLAAGLFLRYKASADAAKAATTRFSESVKIAGNDVKGLSQALETSELNKKLKPLDLKINLETTNKEQLDEAIAAVKKAGEGGFGFGAKGIPVFTTAQIKNSGELVKQLELIKSKIGEVGFQAELTNLKVAASLDNTAAGLKKAFDQAIFTSGDLAAKVEVQLKDIAPSVRNSLNAAITSVTDSFRKLRTQGKQGVDDFNAEARRLGLPEVKDLANPSLARIIVGLQAKAGVIAGIAARIRSSILSAALAQQASGTFNDRLTDIALGKADAATDPKKLFEDLVKQQTAALDKADAAARGGGTPQFLGDGGAGAKAAADKAAREAERAAAKVKAAMLKLANAAVAAAKKVSDGIKSKLDSAKNRLKDLKAQFEDIRDAIIKAFQSSNLFESRSAKQFIKRATKNIAQNSTVLAAQNDLQARLGGQAGSSEFLKSLFESGNVRLIKNLAASSSATLADALAKFNADNSLANKIGTAVANAFIVGGKPLVVGIRSVQTEVAKLNRDLTAALAALAKATKTRDRIKAAAGGVFSSATDVTMGEAGKEVILPMTRPSRALELLLESGALGLPTVAAHLGRLQSQSHAESMARLASLGAKAGQGVQSRSGASGAGSGAGLHLVPQVKVVKERTVNQEFHIHEAGDARLTASKIAARTVAHMDR